MSAWRQHTLPPSTAPACGLRTHSSPDNSSSLVYTRAAQCPAAGYCWSADCGFGLKSRVSAGRGLAPDLAAGKRGLNPDRGTGGEEMVVRVCFARCVFNQ